MGRPAAPSTVSTSPVATLLGWLGVIPFVTFALDGWLDWHGWSDLTLLLKTYALLILSFLCGCLWLEALKADHRLALIASNLIVLVGWPLILVPVALAGLMLAVLFVTVWFGERLVAEDRPGWYQRLRSRLSISVAVLLATGALGHLFHG